jgi:hypothetical protein
LYASETGNFSVQRTPARRQLEAQISLENRIIDDNGWVAKLSRIVADFCGRSAKQRENCAKIAIRSFQTQLS